MLTWKLNDSHPFYYTANIREQMQESFNDWAKHTTLTFSEVSGDNRADFNLAFVYGDHGDGAPLSDGQGGVIAHAFFPWHKYSGQIHFDLTEKWSHK